jgi:hypothetical protein
MTEHFGSLSEYLNTDFWTAKRHELVWRGKNQAIADQQKSPDQT